MDSYWHLKGPTGRHFTEVGLSRELQLVQGQPALAFERKMLLFKSRSHPNKGCSSRYKWSGTEVGLRAHGHRCVVGDQTLVSRIPDLLRV